MIFKEVTLIANLEELTNTPQISKDIVSNEELEDNIIEELSDSETVHNEDQKDSQEYESLEFIFHDFPLGFTSSLSDKVGKLEAQEPLDEIDFAKEGDKPKPTYISSILDDDLMKGIIQIL